MRIGDLHSGPVFGLQNDDELIPAKWVLFDCITGENDLVNIRKFDLPMQISKTKPCPGCSYPIERGGGCEYLTCSKCLTHFCWYCGQKTSMFDGHWSVQECSEVSYVQEKVSEFKLIMNKEWPKMWIFSLFMLDFLCGCIS